MTALRASAVLLGVLVSACSGGEQSTEPKHGSTVKVERIDDVSLLPIVNTDVIVTGDRPSADMFDPIGTELLALGREMQSNVGLASASAVNVMVRDVNGTPWLHLTLPAKALEAVAKSSTLPARTLNLGQEIGFNDIRAERAAREYCAASTTGFCSALLR